MSILQEIKQAQLQARKDRNAAHTAALTTLIGEAVAVGKNDGNRETTDAEVVAVIKKFIKNITDTIEAVMKAPDSSSPRLVSLYDERRLLQSFLPTQLTDEQLTEAVKSIAAELNATTPKDMGKVMGALKQRYEGQYDGSKASAAVKTILSGGM